MFYCDNCNSITFELRDWHHGNSFCEHCGIVHKKLACYETPQGTLQQFWWEHIYSNSELTSEDLVKIRVEEPDLKYEIKNGSFKRIQWLQRQYERKNGGNMRKWRLHNYKSFIRVVNTHFNMTKYQKDIVYDFIVNLGDLRLLHRKCGANSIITALCIHAMKMDGRKIYFNNKKLSKNQREFLDSIGLNEQIYFRIIEKLAHIGRPLVNSKPVLNPQNTPQTP